MANTINIKEAAIIRKLIQDETFLAVFCTGSNMPLVECDEETANDRVFIVETEDLKEELKAKYEEKRIPLRLVSYPKADRLKYFNTLMSMGIDEIVYIGKAGRQIVEVGHIVKRQDFSNIPVEKRPVENPSLQLSGVYFMQEMSKQLPEGQPRMVNPALEEELSANVVKGTYLLPIELMEGDEPEAEKIKNNRFRLPLMQHANGDVYQPLFTDNLELAKINKEGKYKALVVKFQALETLLVKDAKAFMLNPGGFHIALPRELLKNLKVRFGLEDNK